MLAGIADNSIQYPSYTIEPVICGFTLDWTVHSTLDDSDLVVEYPKHFTIGATTLTFSQPVVDSITRLALLETNTDGASNYYIIGTVSDLS